ncbi:MAG: stage III sporulation AC/AD family protein [Oscillospiraceae bacterium]|jgi:stage III sporulation protein AD|nr:stage III sporulation AC/AD family protein [Oscillospiraceae bacterium]
MNILAKAFSLAVTGSFFAVLLKKNTPEISLAMTIIISAVCAFLSVEILAEIINFLRISAQLAEIPNATVAIVLKASGISILTKLTGDVCRDAGQTGAASGVDFIGSIVCVYIALPLFETVIDMLRKML